MAALSAAALILHAWGVTGRPLWSDEASTFWTTKAPLQDLLVGARTDGTPPAYFLLVAAMTRVFGAGEVALRLVSLGAATLLVPAVFVVARRMVSTRAGLMAAGLAAISPLIHYYAIEARSYAVLQLETVAILYAAWRALEEPARKRWSAVLAVACAAQLATHNYALFMLPALPLVCVLSWRKGSTRPLLRTAGASLAAFLAYVPWLLFARSQAARGVGDWIAPFWRDTPPAAAILRSIEVFGFGGTYPVYLSSLAHATSIRELSWMLTAAVIAAALAGRWRPEAPAHPRRAKLVLVSFILVPLGVAWGVSMMQAPIYVVGRYDTIVLPVFLILFAAGLAEWTRTRPAAGWGLVAITAALAVMTHTSSISGLRVDDRDRLAARVIATHGRPSDPVLTTGLRRPAVDYYLEREGRQMEIESFPTEVNDHPGWLSIERSLFDRGRLREDAEALADTMAREGARGHVWLVLTEPNEVDAYLSTALSRRFVVDEECTHREADVYCLAVAPANDDIK